MLPWADIEECSSSASLMGELRKVGIHNYLGKEVKVIDMTSLLDLKHDTSKEASREVILVVEDDESIR